MEPSFSVIVPLFNKRPFLRATIESVLAQSYAPLEVIVVDDGSTDGGAETVADLVERGVRVVRQQNAGPGAARNRGAAAARGDWLALVDADDRWRPTHLTTLAEVIAAHPEADLVGTASLQVDAAAANELLAQPPDGEGVRAVDLFAGPATPPFNASSVAIRRAAFDPSGGFGPWRAGEDTEYWARLALEHPMAVSGRVTSLYLRRTGGVMEREQERMARGEVLPDSPVFATLRAALADPRRVARHALIRRYDATLRRHYARSLLFHGQGGAARRLLAPVRARDAELLGLRLLASAPAPLLGLGLRLRSALRRRGDQVALTPPITAR